METPTLTLLTTTIARADDELVITHSKSGLSTKVSVGQLERWCLRLLRDELSQPNTAENRKD